MFRRNSRQFEGSNDDNPFLLSFSDLMASLLAIFILLLVVTLIELEKRREELRVSKNELLEQLEGIQQTQNVIAEAISGVSHREQYLWDMLKQIQHDLRRNGMNVIIAENGTVLRIPESELQFALGRYDISSGYANKVYTLGKVLLDILTVPDNRAMLDTVFIEGHTDSVVNNREMGNWGLSTYRAIALWNFWTGVPGHLSELKTLQTIPIDPNQHPKPLFSVSGYADTRSTHGTLAMKELKDDRPEDRRIDIRFTLVSSEKKNLESLREEMIQMQSKMKALIEKLKTAHDGH